MARAVLFDLDDTLTDRAATVRRSVAPFRAEHRPLGSVSDEAVFEVLRRADASGYRPRDEMAALIVEGLPWEGMPPTPEHVAEHWRATFPDLAVPMDGAALVLGRLAAAGVALGVITNGPPDTQRRKLRALGFDEVLQATLISEEFGTAKPDPRIFEAALAALAVDAAGAWFVGDNPVADVTGATDAGLTAVWLDGRMAWPVDQPEPAHRISRLPELLDLVL